MGILAFSYRQAGRQAGARPLCDGVHTAFTNWFINDDKPSSVKTFTSISLPCLLTHVSQHRENCGEKCILAKRESSHAVELTAHCF